MIKKYSRKIIQFISAGITNFNIKGLIDGNIYKGTSKGLCVPGLNCYSCPAAGFSCPLGTLQQSLMRIKNGVNTYILGWILLFSALFGRMICGFVCPFGLIQELLYKLPTLKLKPSFKYLRFVKYLVLAIFVIGIPIVVSFETGAGYPAFCKYICPEGTIAGGLLMMANDSLRSLFGMRYVFKLIILMIVVASSIFIFRPFCRVICPLGAIYGLFNSIALVRINVNPVSCTNCGKCKAVCPSRIEPVKECNSPECVRCGKCVSECPQKAIKYTILDGGKK